MKKRGLKPRIVYDASDSGHSTMKYYVQLALLGGIDGSISCTKSTKLEDTKILKEYHALVEELLGMPGVKKVEVSDQEIEVRKIVSAEWLGDGIHGDIAKVLEKHLYGGKSVDLVPLKGSDFPEENAEAGEEGESDLDKMMEAVTQCLAPLGPVAETLFANIDSINVKEEGGAFGGERRHVTSINITFK